MYTAFFTNNKTYGADDINTVMSRLTTQGVSLYNDTGAPLMDLDTAMSNLVSNGADMYDANSCKVVALGNGKFKISKGTYWMPSGACVVFDSDGYTFEADYTTAAGTKGTVCYVYLKQGGESASVSNEVNVVATGEADSHAELLATISSSGAVTDKRVFAQAKLAVPTKNIILYKQIHLPHNIVNGTYQSTSKTYSINLEFAGIQYAYGGNMETYDSDEYSKLVELTSSFQLIRREGYYSFYVRKSDENTIEIYGQRVTTGGWNEKYITLTLF